MVHYFIKFEPVPVKESGYVEGFNTRTLSLDPSYSDKVDFSTTQVINSFKKRGFEVDRNTFFKVLENARRYNSALRGVNILY